MRLLTDQEIADVVEDQCYRKAVPLNVQHAIIGSLWALEKLRREAVPPDQPPGFSSEDGDKSGVGLGKR
jgi:hypothetical protein